MDENNKHTSRLEEGMAALPAALAQMGYTDLREGQLEPLKAVFDGRDTFVVLATGGGKSALYAIPTIALKLKTIVFSPLIALMQDQVSSMNLKGIKSGALNSAQTEVQNFETMKLWKAGELQMMFVAPERLESDQFQSTIKYIKPDLVVLDEAHCMSNWTATFRPAYKKCGEAVHLLAPWVTMALTATATKDIVNDVKGILQMRDPVLCRHYVKRSNLNLTSSRAGSVKEVENAVVRKCRNTEGNIIVYCSYVSHVMDLYDALKRAGESVTYYHGQMQNPTVKAINMRSFMSGESRICVATNAFGMGIDKPDIRLVLHADPPGSIEALAQEVGRAGRDGKPSECHLIFTDEGWHIQESLFARSNPTGRSLEVIHSALRKMADKDDKVYVSMDAVGQSVGMQDGEAAGVFNYLSLLEVIRRDNPVDKTLKVTDNGKDTSVLNATRKAIMDSVVNDSVLDGVSAEGHNVYRGVDVDFMAEKLMKSAGTIKSNLNQLKKDGYIDIITPPKCKITTVLKDISRSDVEAADKRRLLEQQKLMKVVEYVNTPDADKADFIQNYFETR